MKKIIMMLFTIVLLNLGLEIYSCSFLRRYGANSYITNIPLFFKKQDDYEPQRANTEPYTNVVVAQESAAQEKFIDIAPSGASVTTAEATTKENILESNVVGS